MNRKTIIRVGIVLAVVAVIVITAQLLKKPAAVIGPEPVRPVKTMRVLDVPSQVRRVFPGRLAASRQVNLSFLSGGDLIELPVQEGQALQQGDLIAALDARDQEAVLSAARADLDLANSELERSRVLFEEELIAEAEYDVARRSFDVALAAFETASKAVEDRQILAPFSGVVGRRFVENLESVQAGQSIVTYLDPAGVDITIDIPETVVLQLPHFTVNVSAEFQQEPGTEYPLSVKEFAAVADPFTKTYPVTLTMTRPEGIVVLPDMTVTVNLDATRKATIEDSAYLIPSTAIVYDVETDDAVIWVVDETGDPLTVSPRQVEANRAQGGEVVVTGGLESGDLIVIAGGGFLNRGQQVRIFEQ